MSAKRNTLSVEEKVEIIRACEQGQRKVEVSRRFGLANSTICTILKNRNKILWAFENENTKAKRLRSCNRTDVDEALLKWYVDHRNTDISITGPVLKAKAEELAAEFGYESFICTNGWIDRFKTRHSITCGKDKSKHTSRKIQDNKLEEHEIKEEILVQENEVPVSHEEFPTAQDAMNAVDVLTRFYDQKNVCDEVKNSIRYVGDVTERLFWKERLTQWKEQLTQNASPVETCESELMDVKLEDTE